MIMPGMTVFYFLCSGGMGHVSRPVRCIVHVAVPRYLVTGRGRGHKILSDTAVAQTR